MKKFEEPVLCGLFRIIAALCLLCGFICFVAATIPDNPGMVLAITGAALVSNSIFLFAIAQALGYLAASSHFAEQSAIMQHSVGSKELLAGATAVPMEAEPAAEIAPAPPQPANAPEEMFYYWSGDAEAGPIPRSQLSELPLSTLVRSEQSAKWMPLPNAGAGA